MIFWVGYTLYSLLYEFIRISAGAVSFVFYNP